MHKKTWLRIFTTLLVAGMLFGGFAPLGTAAQIPSSDGPVQPEMPLTPGGEGAGENPLAKVDSELRSLAQEGGEVEVDVYILAKTGADLSRVATVTERRPFPDGAELVVATVKASQIGRLASHPDVLAAEKYRPIEAPIPLTPHGDDATVRPSREEILAKVDEFKQEAVKRLQAMESGGAGFEFPTGGNVPSAPDATSDWYGAGLIGAPEAWAKGYTGEGVNIAIIDSGVDFGHPDLAGRQAVYENGPYEGWPIALDPRSMRQYYYNGLTSSDNYWDWWDYSWYADVANVLICLKDQEARFSFQPDPVYHEGTWRTYTIDEDIVNMSQSGEIRWGVHPDEQIYDWIWYDPFEDMGYWVPFILVDSTTPEVYDTVIADLNRDFWFDQYDVMADISDPVLDQDLGSYVYTDTQIMTGTLYTPDGWFGLPPTWYGWETASIMTTVPAGTWIWALNHEAGEDATDGADGVADISGGMVYFIANGELPVPGMDYLYPGIGPAEMPPIPLNGQLVAFMLGSYWAGGGDHGTLCASAAVAGGVSKGYFGATGEWIQYEEEVYGSEFGDLGSEFLPWLKLVTEGSVQGPAPDAKIIAIGDNYEGVNDMQGFYDAYTFLAYGVDGEPNSGDEFVDIMSMSYGDGSVHNDGWDWESRLLSYYNQQYLPNTTMFASSGNGGPGFGTVNSPQGNTVVSVGASTLYGSTDNFGGAIIADQINEGEVMSFSGRGPDAMGRPDPDVVATGAWATGDTPLNLAPVAATVYSGIWPRDLLFGIYFSQDGNNAWYQWGGTSRSAPEAAGVMATIYQAYEEANGVKPDFETARQMLMSGAQDLEHDVLRQGAGRVNADTGTDIAAGLGGVYISPSLLAAGEYMGTHYESFGNVLFPGDTWTQTFTVHNPGASAATVDLGDEMMLELETQTFEQVVRPYLGTEGPYPDTYYYWADYLVSTDPSLAVTDALLRVAHASPDAPPVDVCVDGGLAFSGAPFGAVTDYAALTPGEHFVEVFPAPSDCTGTAVFYATLDLASGEDYTVVATNFLADITPVVLVDDNSQPEEGYAHVRFFHASPDAPAVDVAVAGGGPVLFSDIEFQEASGYLPVPAGSYDLEVFATGTTTPVVLTVPGVTFDAGQVYTVFAMGEITPPAVSAAVAGGTVEWIYEDAAGIEVEQANNGDTVAYPGAYRFVPDAPSQASILVYADDWAHPAPNTYVEQALTSLGLAATVHVNADYAGFQANLNTAGPWDLVIVASENYAPPASLTSDLQAYVNKGGNLLLTYWYMLYYPNVPLWATMGFEYSANYLGNPSVYWWNPADPLFTTPESAPEWTSRIARAGTSDGQYLDTIITGSGLGGYTVAPAADQAGLIRRTDGKTLYKGFLDATNDADLDTDAQPDGVELWINAITQSLDNGSLFAVPAQDTPAPNPVHHGPDLVVEVPEGADFMEVELTVPFEIFDFCYDDPWPDSICYGANERWSLTLYDWTDRNTNDEVWVDNNQDEVVSYWYGDDIEVSATGFVTQTELNRFTYAYNYANVQGATVRLGERDDIDNIVLGLVHRNTNSARGDESYYEANPFLVKVVFYEKVDWPIVETSAASLVVPAGSSVTFEATFTIPDDPSLYGVHEGAITVGDAIIPTTVNVAVPGEELLFNLGGGDPVGIPYENGRMGPGYSWSGVLEEGDWRFYYYDAQTGLDQQYLYVRNQWGDTCGNMPTFNETLVWGANPGDQFSMLEPEKYGPYGMQYGGGTWDANGPQNGWYTPRVWDGWYDGDGIPQPESRAWATLWDGLTQVQFRNVLMSGKVSCGEGFEATAGVFGVDAPRTGILINTTQESGSFSMDAVSPADGMSFVAYDFEDEEFMVNQEVPQGKHPETYLPADLLSGWVHQMELENTGGIVINTQGPGSSDIDLYLLYDANSDGTFNFLDNREVIAASTDYGPYENLESWGDYDNGWNLRNGRYAVVMYGNYIVPGDQFNIKITTYGGGGLSIEGAIPVDDAGWYHLDLAPGELTSLTVNWQAPGPGLWSGMLIFFQPWEEEPMNWYMGPEIFVPVFINKEGEQVSIEKDVSDIMVDWGDIVTYTITVSNEGSEEVWMDLTDVLPEDLELIDGSLTSMLIEMLPDHDLKNDMEDGCYIDYDEWMRTIYYNCHLPYELEGEIYTEDMITFKVRVEGQPGTEYLNKADLKYWWGDWWGPAPYSYLSDTAYSIVPHKVLLPIISR